MLRGLTLVYIVVGKKNGGSDGGGESLESGVLV